MRHPVFLRQMSTLNVSLIQSALHWEDKEQNLRMFEDKLRALPAGRELVVLPEMFNTGFSMNPAKLAETMDGSTISWMKKMAKEFRIVI
ncbi:MAG: hypothetical protein EOO02_20195, partial [Chitinophagaceae bacterium]